jgi:glutathione S-transferase
MIKFFRYDTINTLKVLMFLFETGIDYEFEPINIRERE